VLQAKEPTTITALAEIMVMDRTALGRNLLPLQRRDVVAVERAPQQGNPADRHDERAGKLLTLTEAIIATDFGAGTPAATGE
jgi:hypothetical protein